MAGNLRSMVAKLRGALAANEGELREQFPGRDPYTIRDSSGTPMLLGALSALTIAEAALVHAELAEGARHGE